MGIVHIIPKSNDVATLLLTKYILRKIIWYLLAFLFAVSLNFILPRLIPGNLLAVIVNQVAT